ncbi:MAG: hypothetical protein CK426_08810 [Legionella sp.]|nr:MAG: hypothetical protein CK426_08810 [Legionella sp.]
MKKMMVLMLLLTGFIMGTTAALATGAHDIKEYNGTKSQSESSTDASTGKTDTLAATESTSRPKQE